MIEAFDEGTQRPTQLAMFSADRAVPDHAQGYGIAVRLDAMELHRPRQWGACWLTAMLYEQLGLDRFWADRLPASREGTRWDHVLQTLVSYRLIDPGSEWRLHRLWFERSAMGDILGEDFRLVEKNALYRCLDKVLEHKAALFDHLRRRCPPNRSVCLAENLAVLRDCAFEIPKARRAGDFRAYLGAHFRSRGGRRLHATGTS